VIGFTEMSCVINCSAFSQKHLGQIHTVYPTAYKFQQEKDLPMFGGKASGYQLTIEAILDAVSEDDGMSCVTLCLRFIHVMMLLMHFYHSCIHKLDVIDPTDFSLLSDHS